MQVSSLSVREAAASFLECLSETDFGAVFHLSPRSKPKLKSCAGGGQNGSRQGGRGKKEAICIC